MKKLFILTLIALMALPFAMAQTTVPTTAAPSMTVPISGTTNMGGKVDGTFAIQKFSVINNQLMAVGNLVANVTQQGITRTVVAAGTAIPVATPSTAAGTASTAAAAAGSCSILNLTLGPLDLNLLGLQVHLNQVVLNITAQSGAGNLLGNLLCSVANLLNGGGALADIANLLNQILGALGNLGL
jgi:hypothetical protein